MSLLENVKEDVKSKKESYADSVAHMSKEELIDEQKQVDRYFDENTDRITSSDALIDTLRGRKGLKKDVEAIEDAISLGLAFMGDDLDSKCLFDANTALKEVERLTVINKGTTGYTIVKGRLTAEYYLRLARGKKDIVEDELARRS